MTSRSLCEIVQSAAAGATAEARARNGRFESLPSDEFAAQMAACLDAVLARAHDLDDRRAQEWVESHAPIRAAAGFSAADAVCGFAAARHALKEIVWRLTDADPAFAAQAERTLDEMEQEFVALVERLRGSESVLTDSQAVLLTEALPQPILLVDRHGRATWMTEAFARLCGRTREDLLGAGAIELIPIVAAAFAEPEAVEGSLRASSARPEGSHSDVYRATGGAWLARTAVPIGEGGALGRLVTFSDVSQFIDARDRARRLNEALVHAQERERSHIASELHDGPVQLLAAALIRLDPAFGGPGVEAADELVAELRADLRRAYGEIRSLLFNLRPETLSQQGLAAAVIELAERFEKETGVNVRVEADPAATGRDEHAVVVFRVLQEALINIRKHADATNVQVVLDGEPLAMSIRDDGRGFARDDVAPRTQLGHVGLVTMRERIELAGGCFVVRSKPGEGTQITLCLPPAEK